ncbi:demethylmenaquinone methyltransferase [Fusarium albosuccineum]|uniref:Demethylmenaquinone methyltransferase n=1 Tax=Fusarium albosuccineum TaxID=1237068 RepID=A0A8H4L2F6_9HYPO|nr:demethylmenaquinone methyltransferase [Fusarium albosuccineum]
MTLSADNVVERASLPCISRRFLFGGRWSRASAATGKKAKVAEQPNDQEEQDRMDLVHHIFRLALGGELFLAPVPGDIQRVLDLGTGTGIWAMDLAEVPPNCIFEVDDFESDWPFEEPFDFIHARELEGCIRDDDRLFRQAFQHLTPGGYIELQAAYTRFVSDDDTGEKAENAHAWLQTLIDGLAQFGTPLDCAINWKQKLEAAGFIDVQQEVRKIPIGAWAKDPKLKEIGMYQGIQQIKAVESYTPAVFGRILGWSDKEIQVIMAKRSLEKGLRVTNKSVFQPRKLAPKPNVRQLDSFLWGLVRDKAKVPAYIRSLPALELIEGEAHDAGTIRQLVAGADTVVSTYNGDDNLMIAGQKLLIDAAEESGARRFFASDYTADYRNLEYGQLPSKDPMKEIHEYLQGKKIQGVHVLIGAFLDTFWFSWFGVWKREDLSLSFWGTGDEAWELTSYENTAEFVAELIVDESATGFQKFVGDKKSIRQVAAVFEDVYGQKPKLHRLGSFVELKARMDEVSTANPQDGHIWMPLFYQYYLSSGQFHVGSTGLSSYPGLEQRSVKEYLQNHSLDSLATAMINVGLKD